MQTPLLSRTAPEMAQPPGKAHHKLITQATAHITSASCPAPTSSSHGSLVLYPAGHPPTGTHPVLTSPSGLLTALRKQVVRARGSSAKQRCRQRTGTWGKQVRFRGWSKNTGV